MKKTKPQSELDLLLQWNSIKWLFHFYFTFPVLKWSLGILYTASVYSDAFYWYGEVKEQDHEASLGFGLHGYTFHMYI
jgi:hypothetical protein